MGTTLKDYILGIVGCIALLFNLPVVIAICIVSSTTALKLQISDLKFAEKIIVWCVASIFSFSFYYTVGRLIY